MAAAPAAVAAASSAVDSSLSRSDQVLLKISADRAWILGHHVEEIIFCTKYIFVDIINISDLNHHKINYFCPFVVIL